MQDTKSNKNLLWLSYLITTRSLDCVDKITVMGFPGGSGGKEPAC